ncbi:hypothetical protein K3495_g1571 [Podosphaera aphanis]|nr:hypothetical protein K3495_g1571 [Podosphaera aphanis]
MQIPPLQVLAAWGPGNFINPVTRGNGNVVLSIVLYILSVGVVTLRICTRAYLTAKFGVDDILILLALIPTSAFFVTSLLVDIRFHWMRHEHDIPLENIIPALKTILLSEVLYTAACTMVKLSLLMFIKRAFANATIFWRWVTMSITIMVAIQGFLFCVATIFQCRPIQDFWKLSFTAQPECIDQSWAQLVANMMSTVMDFVVFFLPLRLAWMLKLASCQKLAMGILFTLGLISCLSGAARTYYTYKLSQTWDQTWNSYPVWITSSVELYIGLICVALTATAPFFITHLPHIFSGPYYAFFKRTMNNFRKPSHSSESLDSIYLKGDPAIIDGAPMNYGGNFQILSVRD